MPGMMSAQWAWRLGVFVQGLALLRLLAESTGLPKEIVERELTRLLDRNGLSADTLTLEQIRELLVDLVQEALVEAKEHIESTQ